MKTIEPQYMSNETKELAFSMDQSKQNAVKAMRQIQKLNHLGKTREIHYICQIVVETYAGYGRNGKLEALLGSKMSQAEDNEQWDALQTLVDIRQEIHDLYYLLTLALPYVEEGEEYQKHKGLSKRIKKVIR